MKSHQTPCTKMKTVIDREKRSKKMNVVNPQNQAKSSELSIDTSREKEVPLSHKLQDHAYE